jgi:FO synthase
MTSAGITALIARARDGGRPSEADALSLAECSDIAALMQVAAELRDRGHGDLVSYSRKVFIPLTKLCRDSCHYCTFAIPPKKGERAYLTPEDVLALAERGRQAGCHEASFTLGDKPETMINDTREGQPTMTHEEVADRLYGTPEAIR